MILGGTLKNSAHAGAAGNFVDAQYEERGQSLMLLCCEQVYTAYDTLPSF